MITLDWHGCYGSRWGNEISTESVSHPAKFSRKLIRRIYEFMIGEGLLKAGDTVLDPFGGIALGAADAVRNGINFVGVELEKKFIDFGAGCQCTGISKEDWIRFCARPGTRTKGASRLEAGNHKKGRHWCPLCVAEAATWEVAEPSPQLSLFESSRPSLSYVRNSGQIPHTAPHRYVGNIDRFLKTGRGGARAVLLQGDSRKLLEVLEGAGVLQGVISSPPWGDIEGSKATRKFADPEKSAELLRDSHRPGTTTEAILANMERASAQTYDDSSNLGHLAADEKDFDAVITSSPFAGTSGGLGEASRNGIDAALFDRHMGSIVGGIGEEAEGNLGSMQARSADLDAVITSSPYVESLGSDAPEKRGGLFRDPKRGGDKTLTATYGETEGQLGGMVAGDGPDGVISSPPYEGSVNQHVSTGDMASRAERMVEAGIDIDHKQNIGGPNSGFRYPQTYGQAGGQLGQTSGDTFWSAARLIVAQCHQVLKKKDGHAVFVTKDFVKNGERVPFTNQWIQLCEACGFDLLFHIRAWLVEERGRYYNLAGELIVKEVAYKSFFRRLAEENGSPPIDREDVLVFRIAETREGI